MDRLAEHCRANLGDLESHFPGSGRRQLKRIVGAQLLYVAVHREGLRRRVQSGRVIEGHGDLRAEHIYLEAPPCVIDCVEFCEQLRQVDALDDLCFLAMDCERLGRQEIGDRVIDHYCSTTGDETPRSLIAFYKSYRACVRAKVAALRMDQCDGRRESNLQRLQQLLRIADRHASMLERPALIVVGGPIGSGKSTLARSIAAQIGAELLQTDRTRERSQADVDRSSRFGVGRYSPEARLRVYNSMFRLATRRIDERRSVVLDGTFPTNELRRAALEVAARRNALAIYVACECPREVAIRRIAERSPQGSEGSEARPEFYDAHIREREEMAPNLPWVRIDTTRLIETEKVFDALAKLNSTTSQTSVQM